MQSEDNRMDTAEQPLVLSPLNVSIYQKSLKALLMKLLCQICYKWMFPEEILSCLCRVCCRDCVNGNRKCGQCGLELTADEQVIRFHQRLSCEIPHPCRNSRHGCPIEIQPEDNQNHEETCVFKPLRCLACNNMVVRHELIAHFELTHPDKKVLSDNNLNVLRSQFIDCDATLSSQYINAKIYCMAQGQCFLIDIMKYEVDDTHVILGVEPIFYSEDLTLTVKFEFKINAYGFHKSVVVGKTELNRESIGKELIEDWVNGLNKLNITVAVRKKRRV